MRQQFISTMIIYLMARRCEVFMLYGVKVELCNPDTFVMIRIIQKRAFFHINKKPSLSSTCLCTNELITLCAISLFQLPLGKKMQPFMQTLKTLSAFMTACLTVCLFICSRCCLLNGVVQ